MSSCKKLLGGVESYQVDCFLKTHLPSHYEAKKRLEMGWADWSALKKYSQFAKYYNDHVFYSMAVANVCKIKNPLPIKKADFVGNGAGKYTLDSYRKVQLEDGRVLFEKVYKNDSDDLEKIKFFMECVFYQLNERFKIPSAEVCEGEKGSVVLFDWLDRIVPVDKRNILNFYMDFREAALAVVVPAEMQSSVVCDFTREPMFQGGVKSSENWLASHVSSEASKLIPLSVDFFKNMPSSELVFTHGDIIPANAARDGVVIDFDKCGFYPAGYELAYLSSKSLSFESLGSMVDLLGGEVNKLSSLNQVGFYFFAFIFYSRRVGVKSSDDFLLELWEAFFSRAKEAGIGL